MRYLIFLLLPFMASCFGLKNIDLKDHQRVENVYKYYPLEFCQKPPDNPATIDEEHDGQHPLPAGVYKYTFINKENLDPAMIAKRKYCIERVNDSLQNLQYLEVDTLGIDVFKIGHYVYSSTHAFVGTTNLHQYFLENWADTTIFNSHYGWLESPLPRKKLNGEWDFSGVTCRLEDHEQGHKYPAWRHGHLNPWDGYIFNYDQIAKDLNITLQEAIERYSHNSLVYYWAPFNPNDVMNYWVYRNWVFNPEIGGANGQSNYEMSQNEWNRLYELYGKRESKSYTYQIGQEVIYWRRSTFVIGTVSNITERNGKVIYTLDLYHSNFNPHVWKIEKLMTPEDFVKRISEFRERA